jgi:hypothetical protein
VIPLSRPPDTERAIPGSWPTLSCAGAGCYDLLFPIWSLPKLALRSEPVDLPDPLAELLILGLLAETG